MVRHVGGDVLGNFALIKNVGAVFCDASQTVRKVGVQ